MIAMSIANTCQNCEERHLKCHATCQKYLDAKAENERVKQSMQKEVSSQLHQYKVESIRKYRKRHGK